jgi:hypothetical protein
MLYNRVRGRSLLLERYAYAMMYDYAHSLGLRSTSMSSPSTVPFPPMLDMYSHLAVSGRLSSALVCLPVRTS